MPAHLQAKRAYRIPRPFTHHVHNACPAQTTQLFYQKILQACFIVLTLELILQWNQLLWNIKKYTSVQKNREFVTCSPTCTQMHTACQMLSVDCSYEPSGKPSFTHFLISLREWDRNTPDSVKRPALTLPVPTSTPTKKRIGGGIGFSAAIVLIYGRARYWHSAY